MEARRPGAEHESEPHIIVCPPATELFLNDKFPADPEVAEQLTRRRELVRPITRILDELPYPLVPVESLGLNEAKLIDLYRGFAELLDDPENERLALYFPFELMPVGAWPDVGDEVLGAMFAFRHAYMEAWRRLLRCHDVRANFVDGDVMEVDRREGDLPRVVKAAHLVPGLMGRGMITGSEVVTIIEESVDPLLREDLCDALTVAEELGLLLGSDRLKIFYSDDLRVQEFSKQFDRKPKPKPKTERPFANFAYIPKRLELKLRDIETILRAQDATPNRTKWLRSQVIDDVVSSLAYETSALICETDFATEILQDGLVARVYIEAASIAIREDASAYLRINDKLEYLWQHDQADVIAELTRLYRHLFRQGLVTEGELQRRGVTLPALSGPLSENLSYMTEEITHLERAVHNIASDTELSAEAFPVVMLYGSRLKGYGDQRSDVDIGVFLKPGARSETVDQLMHFVGDKPVEFWLDDEDGDFSVRNGDYGLYRAEKHWVHMLFNAVWIGEASSVRELQEKLLPGYFRATASLTAGRTDRQLYLERMEQDLLQYRLMHKGYKAHFPIKGIETESAGKVDGASAFWDPGYRLAATRLFINHVYLPRI